MPIHLFPVLLSEPDFEEYQQVDPDRFYDENRDENRAVGLAPWRGRTSLISSRVAPLWSARIGRYAAIGSLAAALYAATVWVMIHWLSIGPLAASSIAFLVVVVVNYQFHYHWTFVSRKAHTIAFSQFLITSVLGFTANYGILYFGFVVEGFNYVAVQIVAIVVIVTLNFILSAFWVFRG